MTVREPHPRRVRPDEPVPPSRSLRVAIALTASLAFSFITLGMVLHFGSNEAARIADAAIQPASVSVMEETDDAEAGGLAGPTETEEPPEESDDPSEETTDEATQTSIPEPTASEPDVTAEEETATDEATASEETATADARESASAAPTAVQAPAPAPVTPPADIAATEGTTIIVGPNLIVMPTAYGRLGVNQLDQVEEAEFIGPAQDRGLINGAWYDGVVRLKSSGLKGNSEELQQLIDGSCLSDESAKPTTPPDKKATVDTAIGALELVRRTYVCPDQSYTYAWWYATNGTFAADYFFVGDRIPEELTKAFMAVKPLR